jgi:hypothetical protein
MPLGKKFPAIGLCHLVKKIPVIGPCHLEKNWLLSKLSKGKKISEFNQFSENSCQFS